MASIPQAANQALTQFDLDVAAIELLGNFTNTLFKVRSQSGGRYVLRLCRPGWRSDGDLLSEALWLQALHEDTDIGAPQPFTTRNGEFIARVPSPDSTEPQRCMLFSWVAGSPLGDRLNTENFIKFGRLFAQLHLQAANFSPPQGFTCRKMETLYARGEENVLFSPANEAAFSPRTRRIFEQVLSQVDEEFARLYADRAGLRVIHNDLGPGNIKVYHGRLHPLDFEDTLWGYPVQDLAMSLQDLMREVNPDRYDPLLDALRAGYEEVSNWPEDEAGQIDTFRAGRLLWVSNYVAQFERQYLQEHLEFWAGPLERFLDTGKLRLG